MFTAVSVVPAPLNQPATTSQLKDFRVTLLSPQVALPSPVMAHCHVKSHLQ